MASIKDILTPPDQIGSSEYRAIHECLTDCVGDIADAEQLILAKAILGEFIQHAEAILKQISHTTVPDGDDLCDQCMRSGVAVSRTEDGKTICVDCDDNELNGVPDQGAAPS